MSPVVLYDGLCGLCDSSVQWLLDHDAEGRLRYAPLQGETAEELRGLHPGIPAELETMVLVDEGRVFLRSRAILQICRHLPRPWSWAAVLSVLPTSLTDAAYRVLAANRYRIWGKLEACRLPEPEQAARFLP